MGCFSWMFADHPDKNLKIGCKEYYVPFPSGRILKCHDYDGYGVVNGFDVATKERYEDVDLYVLFAIWNRHKIINTLSKEQLKDCLYMSPLTKEQQEKLVEAFTDPEIETERFLSKYLKDDKALDLVLGDSLRYFGIDFDIKNKELIDFPIKISEKPVCYNFLSASEDDKTQGGLFELEDNWEEDCDEEDNWDIDDDN